MDDRIHLELDTPLEFTLKALTTLGIAGSLILALVHVAFPSQPVKAALVLCSSLAGISGILASQLNNFYILDLPGRRLLYVSSLLGQVKESTTSFEDIVATSILTCVEYPGKYAQYYTAPALVLRSGKVLRVGDYELLSEGAHEQARELAQRIGCPFREVQPQMSIGAQVNPLTKELQLGEVPAHTGSLSRMLLSAGGALAAVALAVFLVSL